MTPTAPQDDIAADMPGGAAAPMQSDLTPAPETPAEPEDETDDEWARRFIEENVHLMAPPVVRPPAPPPQPWDGPRSQWKVPDHLSMPHPNGGYMAMALMSRTMDDLDEVTGGKRAATYEEVDKYFGHALIAEGLVPFTYTADEAIRWWKAGGFKVLGRSASDIAPQEPILSLSTSSDQMRGPADFGKYAGDNGRTNATEMSAVYSPNNVAKPLVRPAVDFRIIGSSSGISSDDRTPENFSQNNGAALEAPTPVADRSLMSAPLYRSRPQLGWNPVRPGDDMKVPSAPSPPPLTDGDGEAAGPYASAPATLNDWVMQSEAWKAVQYASSAYYKRAARALAHYLDRSGDPLKMDLRDMMDTIPDFKLKQHENFDLFIVEKSKWLIKKIYRGQDGHFPMKGEWTTVQPEAGSDWYFTLNGFSIAHTAIVQYSPGINGLVNVTIRPAIYMFDRYNWDKDKGVRLGRVIPISDAQMGRWADFKKSAWPANIICTDRWNCQSTDSALILRPFSSQAKSPKPRRRYIRRGSDDADTL